MASMVSRTSTGTSGRFGPVSFVVVSSTTSTSSGVVSSTASSGMTGTSGLPLSVSSTTSTSSRPTSGSSVSGFWSVSSTMPVSDPLFVGSSEQAVIDVDDKIRIRRPAIQETLRGVEYTECLVFIVYDRISCISAIKQQTLSWYGRMSHGAKGYYNFHVTKKLRECC